MSFALAYLVQRFVFRATDFFHHWYVDGSLAMLHALTRVFERTDRWLAVAVSWHRIFATPREGERFFPRAGRIFVRLVRVVAGLAAFSVIIVAFVAFFVVWLAVPLAIPLSVMQHISAPAP